jgi:hypothetical protein
VISGPSLERVNLTQRAELRFHGYALFRVVHLGRISSHEQRTTPYLSPFMPGESDLSCHRGQRLQAQCTMDCPVLLKITGEQLRSSTSQDQPSGPE